MPLRVTLATFMEVLDTSGSPTWRSPTLPEGWAASQDEATWVLTSYLVANAVILPASAYLTTFLGRKRFYMICVMLFGISSALCWSGALATASHFLPRASRRVPAAADSPRQRTG